MKSRVHVPLLSSFALCAACSTSSVSADANIATVALGKQADALAAPAVPGVNVPAIKVDTVGYPSSWPKVVIFNVDPAGAQLFDANGQAVGPIEATPKALGEDAASKDPVWQVDLGELPAGRYSVGVGEARSDLFEVGPKVYDTALVAAQKHFYFQRTRTALVEPYAVWEGDAYLRETASHVHDDVGWDLLDYPAKKRKWTVEGGWHDAGNFDMYVPSTAPTSQALLMAYDANPSLFADNQLNIPESGNGVPDLLDEARWGIVWVLSMQEDSGVFRANEAVVKWSPEGPADKDKTERWIAGPSSSATAKAVAVLARASVVYRPFDAKFADRCAAAAKKGWTWLEQNPGHLRAEKAPDSEQPLWDDEPEFNDFGARFIAASEMWRAFQEPAAQTRIAAALADERCSVKEINSGAWANLSRWGVAVVAADDTIDAKLREDARTKLRAAADELRMRVEAEDGYRCASGLNDYYWAHNSNLLEKAHVLAVAAEVFDEPAYEQAARDQWHWILGRNPNGYSMVTRVGKGPTTIYHMEWGETERPPPGYLVGGPNYSNMRFLSPDAPAKALLWDNPRPLRTGTPAHAMWHWKQEELWEGGFIPEGEWIEGWWAVTEPDIIYNANLVLVGASLI